MGSIKENVLLIQDNIRQAAQKAGRSPQDIILIAVTKTVEVQEIQSAIDAGITHIGENRVQEAQEKFPQLTGPVSKHLIGHLQRNKVKSCSDLFTMIQSVDSLRLAKEINNHVLKTNGIMDILIQVNVGGEDTKFGVFPGELQVFVEKIRDLKGLNVCGLMAIPPFDPEPENTRPYFRQMYELFANLKSQFSSFSHLSMGMSGDYAVAIEEGATMVRVGTGIFGARTTREGK